MTTRWLLILVVGACGLSIQKFGSFYFLVSYPKDVFTLLRRWHDHLQSTNTTHAHVEDVSNKAPLSAAPSHTSNKNNRPPIPEPSVDTQEFRKETLRSFCREKMQSHLNLSLGCAIEEKGVCAREALRQILVDDKHQVLYCAVEKVGSSVWKRKMMEAHGLFDIKNITCLNDLGPSIRTLSSYSKPQIQHRLHNYYKFMFVRHPLSRLVSAFRDKLVPGKHTGAFLHNVGADIIRWKKSLGLWPMARKYPTMEDFIQYILYSRRQYFTNEHWRAYHRLCLPCAVNYDTIGRMETFVEDANPLLERLYKNTNVRFFKSKTSRLTDLDTARDMLVNITEQDRRNLHTRFNNDVELFGYGWGDLLVDNEAVGANLTAMHKHL